MVEAGANAEVETDQAANCGCLDNLLKYVNPKIGDSQLSEVNSRAVTLKDAPVKSANMVLAAKRGFLFFISSALL